MKDPDAYNYAVCQGCGKLYVKRYTLHLYCSPKCNPKKKKEVDRNKKPEVSIMEINRLDAAEHLTYGQYCARHNL